MPQITACTTTQDELVAEARRRFGDDPLGWGFQCPTCADVATPADFRAAGVDPQRAGQECLGRHMGALETPQRKDGRNANGRGCDWTAYGLLRGPWEVVMPDGRSVWAFPLAEGRQ